jgi:hypothetical protein
VGDGNGNGNGDGQAGAPPTTSATATTTGNGQGNGNGQDNDQGNGNGEGNGPGTTLPARTATTAGQAPIADPPATTVTTGRVATFLAASQVLVETDSGAPLPASQSSPGRMISWLLTANQQRFLPIVASPFVALMVVGRALTSAGSGAVAPVVLLAAVGFTKQLDRRRAKSLASMAFPE